MEKELYEIHQQHLKKGENYDDRSFDILQIIGNIGKVLEDYATKTNVSELRLNKLQLEKIGEILTNKNSINNNDPKNKNTLLRHKTNTELTFKKDINTNLNRYYNDDELCYTFYEKNSLLFSLFGKNITSKMLYIFDNTLVETLIILLILSYTILQIITSLGTLYHAIYSIIFFSVSLPYCIYFILSMNRTCIKLIINQFEFWFKLGSVVCYVIAMLLNYFVVNYDKWKYPKLTFVERTLFGISFILSIVAVSCFDAKYISRDRVWKIIVLSILGIGCLYWSMAHLVLSNVTNVSDTGIKFYLTDTSLNIASNISISLSSIEISTLRNLGIFLLRQTYVTYTHTNKATMLKKNATVIWNSDRKLDDENYSQTAETVKSILYKLHLYNSDHDKFKTDLAHQTKLYLGIFGGIDKILANYLHNSENEKITGINQQYLFDEIYDLQQNKFLFEINKDKTHFYYFFDANDTILNYICSKKASYAMECFFGHYIWAIILCLSMTLYLALLITRLKTFYVLLTQTLICLFIFIPTAINLLLNVNRTAFKLIAQTNFEFSIKIGYSLLYVTCVFIDNHIVIPESYGNNRMLAIIQDIVWDITYILTVTCVASATSVVTLSRPWKLLIAFAVSVMSLFWTIQLMYISYTNEEKRLSGLLRISSKFTISFLAITVSSSRVVAIFFCQQFISLIRKKSLVKYVPCIEWHLIDDNYQLNDIVNTEISVVPNTNPKQHIQSTCDVNENVEEIVVNTKSTLQDMDVSLESFNSLDDAAGVDAINEINR